MIGKRRSGVFLSYARRDGEEIAANLRLRLQTEVPDIDIKQDRLLLEGGIGWWKQLMAAIDSVEYVILVMTPLAIQSEMVRKEWRYARQQGVCVYPVKGAPDSALQFSKLPGWMRKSHFFDLDKEWATFIAHLRRGCDTPRIPFMAPDLPNNFVERRQEYQLIKDHLLSSEQREPLAITTALTGAGGFGKTTLAAAICHDEDVIQSFDDGILWVTLGQQPNVLSGLTAVYAALTGTRPEFSGIEDAENELVRKLEDRTCLLVIDDVWDAAHLRPFLRGGTGCTRIFTTRDAGLASTSPRVKVDEMREVECIQLLTSGISGFDQALARKLSRRLGEWPLALELARATVLQRIDYGDTPDRAAQHVITALSEGGLLELRKDSAPEERFRTIGAVLAASLEELSQRNAADRERVEALSIFPEDEPIPLRHLAILWDLKEWQAEKTAHRIADLSLAKLDLGQGTLRLHDVITEWLSTTVQNKPLLHARLLDAWRDFRHLPDAYSWRWVAWHLIGAGRRAQLQELLFDSSWLQAKLNATNINSLIADLEYLKPAREPQLIQAALRLSAHVLAQDKTQLWSQLAGRLDSDQCPSLIHSFCMDQVMLIPCCPSLTLPGNSLLRSLRGHTGGVRDVELYAENTRAISASEDHTVKVWDLDMGDEVRTLKGHTAGVNGIALYPDGSAVVSASEDHTLKVWDLQTGATCLTLSGHEGDVIAVAVYGGGSRAISGSEDRTIRLWDLHTGLQLGILRGHTGVVNDVSVYGNGARAISASEDGTLKLWDLEQRCELHTLNGHTHGVNAVAVYADGTRAISASEDRMLKVWDLNRAVELLALGGHTYGVRSVVVTRDDKQAISGSDDNTVKLWDLSTPSEVGTLSGHTHAVNAVAISPDGRFAISASEDGSLKSWDLNTKSPLRGRSRHAGGVSAVAIYADGKRVLSASEDRTLKVWDMDTGTGLQTLTGQSYGVSAVAVFANGTLAVSASDDGKLKVWDLEKGTQLHTLAGHTNGVSAVAVFANDTRAISASYDHTLKVWDLSKGAEVSTLTGHRGGVTAVAVFGGGTRALSASEDGTLNLWDLETGMQLHTLSGHTREVTAVVVLADARHVISASEDNSVKLWDLETLREIRTFEGHTAGVSAVSVTSDGLRAVSTSYDATVRLWELQTGRLLATFYADAPTWSCATSLNRVVIGDQLGQLHFLRIVPPGHRMQFMPPLVEVPEAGEQSDERLVQLSRSGDASAFSELVGRHYRTCLKRAILIIRNRADAEDEVQSACWRAFQSLDQFREEFTFAAWLSRIVENQCLMRVRERRNSRFVYLDASADSDRRLGLFAERDLELQVSSREVNDHLRREIEQMPALTRTLLILAYIDRLPIAEIAARLEISVSTVKSRLSRARHELRSRMYKHLIHGKGDR